MRIVEFKERESVAKMVAWLSEREIPGAVAEIQQIGVARSRLC